MFWFFYLISRDGFILAVAHSLKQTLHFVGLQHGCWLNGSLEFSQSSGQFLSWWLGVEIWQTFHEFDLFIIIFAL